MQQEQKTKGPAFRKRNQIAQANRTMFIWVAAVSAVFGVALVAVIFLVQMLIFNEKVLAEKQNTIKTLEIDNTNITKLESAIRVLDTNTALASVKADSDDQTIQAVLDALPSEANSLALGASLQNKLLSGINGLSLNSIQVNPVEGVESLSSNTTTAYSSSDNEITFNFAVSGDETALKQSLVNLERSIRTINIVSLEIQSQGTTQVMSVSAKAFYEPTKVVQLTDKVVK